MNLFKISSPSYFGPPAKFSLSQLRRTGSKSSIKSYIKEKHTKGNVDSHRTNNHTNGILSCEITRGGENSQRTIPSVVFWLLMTEFILCLLSFGYLRLWRKVFRGGLILYCQIFVRKYLKIHIEN